MADVDDILRLADSLDPHDRVALIARLWKSLPQENWPRRTEDELVESHRQLAKAGVVRNESVP